MSRVILRSIFITPLLFLGVGFLLPTQVAAVTGSDFKAGRIIDDSVFNYKSSMSITQIQQFLDSKMPSCDRWGTQPYAGTTRRAYAEARGIVFPLTCLNGYYENTTTKENNLEGRGVPSGAKSAAHIIWDAAQTYDINPQTLVVLLQKEQNLILDDWPWPIQYRSATGYGCPDTAPCDSEYYGFYNQVNNAARQFRRYATYPDEYNFATGTNFIQWNPQASCGGNTVYIESQATASLYNYTPYQPNAAALANLYGEGDSCSAYGNRNFWRYFSDWFGSTTIFDPYGWSVIKTSSDSREYLVVGNTKRWIPSGEIYSDWNLSLKPAQTVSQSYLDSIPTLPPLGRFGWFNNTYYYVNGGKRYALTNDNLLRAWGEINNKALAVPAYIPLSTLTDAGEATFYISQPQTNQVARLINGQRVTINSDADRWRANPTQLTSSAYDTFSTIATVDYHVQIDGIKYLVDNGRLLEVNSSTLLQDYSQTSNTFVPIPSEIKQYLSIEKASSLVQVDSNNAWFALKGGSRYYVLTGHHAAAWSLPSTPTVISAKLSLGFPQASVPLPLVVREQESNKLFMFDGARRELTGVAYDAIQASNKTIEVFPSNILDSLSLGSPVSSPIIQSQGTSNLYAVMNGSLFHIPNTDVLHGLGYPRKYNIVTVGSSFVNAQSSSVAQINMFIQNAGTTYFLQDGNAFSIHPSAITDWTHGKPIINNLSPSFSNRFNVVNSNLQQFIQEGDLKYIISNGAAYNSTHNQDTLLPNTHTWQSVAIFGMTRTGSPGYLLKSTNDSDSRVWLINNGLKQHIISWGGYAAYSKQASLPVVKMSPSLLSTYSEVSAGIEVSPLIHTEGYGFKLLDEYGMFQGFKDSDTLIHFATSNTAQQVSHSIYNTYTQHKGNVSRLIKDPSGKVYWVENGKKRWITTGSAYQRYAGNSLTSVHWNVVGWLPTGTNID